MTRKNCAEHNMLVDLGRNDLGKISKFGTVEVEKYMSIERLFTCNAYWFYSKRSYKRR